MIKLARQLGDAVLGRAAARPRQRSLPQWGHRRRRRSSFQVRDPAPCSVRVDERGQHTKLEKRSSFGSLDHYENWKARERLIH